MPVMPGDPHSHTHSRWVPAAASLESEWHPMLVLPAQSTLYGSSVFAYDLLIHFLSLHHLQLRLQ